MNGHNMLQLDFKPIIHLGGSYEKKISKLLVAETNSNAAVWLTLKNKIKNKMSLQTINYSINLLFKLMRDHCR